MSTLVTNTITGLSTAANITIGSTPVVSASANSLTIRGEGSAQTSIQQGLAKAWATLTGTGTISLDDSLNVASISDEGVGDYETTYTSAFSSATKSTVASGGYWGCNVEIDGAGTAATSIFICKDIGDESQRDPEVLNTAVHGDLA